jgi:hypothetical protein
LQRWRSFVGAGLLVLASACGKSREEQRQEELRRLAMRAAQHAQEQAREQSSAQRKAQDRLPEDIPKPSVGSAQGGSTSVHWQRASITGASLIGHTSVALKLRDSDGHKAAFKPVSIKGGTRYRGEIVAWELANLLGIAALVPEALAVELPRTTLTTLAPALADQVPVKDPLRGALIPWIEGLEQPPLEQNKAVWQNWLKRGVSIPEDQVVLARELSVLLVFDYLTGNFDRMSGGNFGRKAGHLLFIDNDGAFLDPMPREPLAASKQRLASVERFSKSFLASLFAPELATRFMEGSEASQLSANAKRGFGDRLSETTKLLQDKLARGQAEMQFE